MLHQMVTPVISRHKHDFNRYDAFGNAIGNSIVSKLSSQPKQKSQDPDNGKYSPNQFEEFDVMGAAQAQQQKENQRLGNMVNWGKAFTDSDALYNSTSSRDVTVNNSEPTVLVNPMTRDKPFDYINNKKQTSIDPGRLAGGLNGGRDRVNIDPGQGGSSFFDGAIDLVGRSFERYGDAFERIYDAGSDAFKLNHLKNSIPEVNSLSLSGEFNFREVIDVGLSLNLGVQSSGEVGLSFSSYATGSVSGVLLTSPRN
jgi:hypothetical protein